MKGIGTLPDPDATPATALARPDCGWTRFVAYTAACCILCVMVALLTR